MCCVLYTTHQERYVCFYFKYLEQFCILYQISWLNNGFWCFCWLHSEQHGLVLYNQPPLLELLEQLVSFQIQIHYFYIGLQLLPFCRNRLGLQKYILEVYDNNKSLKMESQNLRAGVYMKAKLRNCEATYIYYMPADSVWNGE